MRPFIMGLIGLACLLLMGAILAHDCAKSKDQCDKDVAAFATGMVLGAVLNR